MCLVPVFWNGFYREGRIYEGSADPRRAHAFPTFLVSPYATTGTICDAILSSSIAMSLMRWF